MNRRLKISLLFFFIAVSGCSNYKTFNELDNKVSYYQEEVNAPDDAISQGCDKKKNKNQFIDRDSRMINEVDIEIPNSRQWYKNILEAYTSKSSITKQFKRRYNAYISWKLDSGKTCRFPAGIRISGDWKDHISVKNSNVVASIDVKLKQGNFNGYTWFKLLLPEARNGDSEVFSANLMKEIGFISPRTHYVKVSLNGAKYWAISQENATKEMLEINHRRESAIIETNEELYFDPVLDTSLDAWHSPKIINKDWTNKSTLNKKIAFNALNLFSVASNKVNSIVGNTPAVTSYNDFILGGLKKTNESDLEVFRVVSLALGGQHGLNNLNSRFYYDPFSISFQPIYYDGDTHILKPTWRTRQLTSIQVPEQLILDLSLDDINKTLSRLSNIDLNNFHQNLILSGLNISLDQVENALYDLNSKVKSIGVMVSKKKKEIKYKDLENFDIDSYGRVFFISDNKFRFCIINLDQCNIQTLNDIEINKLLSGTYKKEGINYLYSGKYDDFNSNINKSNYDSEYKFFDFIGSTLIYSKGDPSILISNSNKIIDIQLKSINDKVVFKDGSLKDLTIRIYSPFTISSELEQRYDSSLITSQITFMDLEVSQINIISNGGFFEDSINFVRSDGSIDNIIINNSRQDALDLDFSNLSINKLNINAAGNDCLDVSAGKYLVKNAILSGCTDKAISVGEGAILTVNRSDISKSKSAFVVKDSSFLSINKSSIKEVENCYQLYRKKQEFGGSYFVHNDLDCTDADFFVQPGSYVEVN